MTDYERTTVRETTTDPDPVVTRDPYPADRIRTTETSYRSGPTGGEVIRRFVMLLFGILLIFTGVQLVTLGLLAEMQARTYHESQDKPVYVIRQVLEQPEPQLADHARHAAPR